MFEIEYTFYIIDVSFTGKKLFALVNINRKHPARFTRSLNSTFEDCIGTIQLRVDVMMGIYRPPYISVVKKNEKFSKKIFNVERDGWQAD